MAKEQVAFLLASTEVVNACTTPGHSLAYLGVLHPRVFELVLDGLAELGVNPNELVRAQAGAEGPRTPKDPRRRARPQGRRPR